MKRLTLTFDNGPHAIGTPIVLHELAIRNIEATFFLVGDRLLDPELRSLADLIQKAGHRIGNHTMTHGKQLGFRDDPATVEHEIGATQTLLTDLTSELLFRPNGGGGHLDGHTLGQAAVDYLCDNRYTAVTWNSVPGDWLPPEGDWVARALESLQGLDWPVVVLHDFCTLHSRWLASFLDAVLKGGYQFSRDFPADCVVIDNGVCTAALERLYEPRI